MVGLSNSARFVDHSRLHHAYSRACAVTWEENCMLSFVVNVHVSLQPGRVPQKGGPKLTVPCEFVAGFVPGAVLKFKSPPQPALIVGPSDHPFSLRATAVIPQQSFVMSLDVH